MPIELRLLTYSAALLFVLIAIQGSMGVQAQGLKTMAGNRDTLAPAKPFEGRARRALYNHMEAMLMFTPLVLVAAQQNIHSDLTVLGARLFFYGRVGHALAYLIGIPWVRTAIWAVSMAGIILLFLALFGLAA